MGFPAGSGVDVVGSHHSGLADAPAGKLSVSIIASARLATSRASTWSMRSQTATRPSAPPPPTAAAMPLLQEAALRRRAHRAGGGVDISNVLTINPDASSTRRRSRSSSMPGQGQPRQVQLRLHWQRRRHSTWPSSSMRGSGSTWSAASARPRGHHLGGSGGDLLHQRTVSRTTSRHLLSAALLGDHRHAGRRGMKCPPSAWSGLPHQGFDS